MSVGTVWMSPQPMPPYYPNLITTQPNVDISNHIEKLNGLLPPGWGIKDSYSDLHLEEYGFSVAISGSWFSISKCVDSQYTLSVDHEVTAVQSEAGFVRWIAAWDSAMSGKIFPSGIWRKDQLEFVFVERNNQVVGGFLLNRSGCDIGISNWFGEFDVISAALREVVTPSQGVVGYANDEELPVLSGLGFEPLQAMKVWMSN